MAGELLSSAQAEELGILEKERSLHESRLKRYGLEELCWDLKFQEFSSYKIAKECNAKLIERIKSGDNTRYVMVNAANVEQFLRSSKMELEKSPTNTDTNNLSVVQAHNKVMDKLARSVSILESELDKLRNPETPVLESRANFFLNLLQEVRATVELMAKIQGQLQPAISINILTQNMERFCDKIEAEKRLTDDAKHLIINLAADTMSPDLVGGKPVIDVPHREIGDKNEQAGTRS